MIIIDNKNMVATDNQILMAAAYIAAGLLSNQEASDGMPDDAIAEYGIKMALLIAERIPEDSERDLLTDEKIKEVLTKYCTTCEGVGMSKLASLIATGEGMTSRKATNIIYRGEYLGLIENIGASRPVYVLR